MKPILSITLSLLIAGLATAQSAEETKFRQAQAKKLAAFGSKALKKGFPRKAKLVFLMVLSEYDPDNEVAHKKLGHTKSGTAWTPDPAFKYPKAEKPDAAAAKSLRNEYVKLSKDLARAHKDMAAKYEKAGRTDMAQFHYRRIQRFAPDDEDARKKLELVTVKDGLSGTGVEQEIYKRGVKLDDIIKLEGSKDYPVEELPDTDRHPVLEKAQVEYKSVKSEHFIVRGDYEVEILKEAAVWAERAYRVIGVAYAGHERMFVQDTKRWRITQYSFFKTRDTFKQIVTANQAMFPSKDYFDFIIEHTSSCGMGNINVRAAAGKSNVLDGAVRGVAHSFSAMRPAALTEGIGHTFVGLMLRNNRAFIADLKEQLGTQTEEEEIDEFNPDMDLWEDLAIEQAWKKTNVPAVQLPLIHASKFSDEMRIKAWSFCHYLVLRNPELLRHFDMTGDQRNVIDIEKKFTKSAGVSLEQLEKEWKDFFTGATPVMRAIKKRVDPMTAVGKDVKKWLTAINALRVKHHAAPVNWSSSFSTRCKEHSDYLTENKLTGPIEEQRQDPQRPLSSHPGNMFAQMAMVSTHASNPKKTIAEWMQYPGYRDLFFVNTLKTIGLYADKKIVVLNVVQGLVTPRRPSFYMYPRSNAGRVPNSVKVADLGPELQAFLAKNGHADKKVVGYPLSLHFGNSGRMPKRDSIRCTVTRNDRENIQGLIHIGDDGSNRRTASPGLVVFYPLVPIKKGSSVKVEWTFKNGNRMERFDNKFTH